MNQRRIYPIKVLVMYSDLHCNGGAVVVRARSLAGVEKEFYKEIVRRGWTATGFGWNIKTFWPEDGGKSWGLKRIVL